MKVLTNRGERTSVCFRLSASDIVFLTFGGETELPIDKYHVYTYSNFIMMFCTN